MMKEEFETLAMIPGGTISPELYIEIEAMYNKAEETKFAFVDRLFGTGNDKQGIREKLENEKENRLARGRELKKSSRKKNDFLGVRMTKIEKEIIKHFARAEGLTASDFVRRVAIEYIARRAMCLKGEKT